MSGLIRTNDVLFPDDLMNLFCCDGEECDGPDLNDCGGVVQVCDGEWRREPGGALWRFWQNPERDDG